MKRVFIFFLALICIKGYSQVNMDSIAQATEFEIPISGAFTLLGKNPKNVASPGFTKDIKLDYFISDFSLKPNLAFEFQPFWLFGFQNKTLEQYRKPEQGFLRFLSTASVSLGTLHDKDSVNRIAYSIKMSIQKDPMMDVSYTNSIQKLLDDNLDKWSDRRLELTVQKFRAKNMISELVLLLDSLNKIVNKSANDLARIKASKDEMVKCQDTIESNTVKLSKIEEDQSKDLDLQLKKAIKDYKEKNWFRPKADIGFGRLDTYSDSKITNLKFRNKGYGFWLNPSIGFVPARWFNKNATPESSNKLIITGMLKIVSSDSLDQKFFGGNIRYGSKKVNLFIEYTYERDGNNITQSIAYGGQYEIDQTKVIQFGIRHNYDDKLNFKELIPVFCINWKFINDLIKKK